MSSCRIILTLAIMTTLAGCGFHPLYGGSENAAINSQLGAIQIETIEDRVGQKIHNFCLTGSIHTAGREPALHVEFDRTDQQSGTRAKILRGRNPRQTHVSANYFLTDNQSGAILMEGTVRSVNSYNIPDSEFARVAAKTTRLIERRGK